MSRPKADPVERALDIFAALTEDEKRVVIEVMRQLHKAVAKQAPRKRTKPQPPAEAPASGGNGG